MTYKPGWTFEVYDGQWEGLHLVIRTKLEDANLSHTSGCIAKLISDGEKQTSADECHCGAQLKTVLDIHSMMPPMESIEQFERWLAWRLGRIELHEMREFLQLDSKPIFDPHAEFAEHDR